MTNRAAFPETVLSATHFVIPKIRSPFNCLSCQRQDLKAIPEGVIEEIRAVIPQGDKPFEILRSKI